MITHIMNNLNLDMALTDNFNNSCMILKQVFYIVKGLIPIVVERRIIVHT